jgi:hypothetical protein
MEATGAKMYKSWGLSFVQPKASFRDKDRDALLFLV